jgi:hypothetical protein
MCLLNGELGGSLPASVDFGKEEIYTFNYLYQEITSELEFNTHVLYTLNSTTKEYELATTYDANATYYIREKDNYGKDKQVLQYKYLTLATIVREGVHAWAQEDYGNIILSDLDTYGLEQLTYRGSIPLYIIRNS